jgi:UDPglucose 6-dehydrogenase
MKIAVIGTGYVGVVTAAIFADLGNQVWAVDVDRLKIKTLKAETLPFYEPRLKEIVIRNLRKGNLIFHTSYEESMTQAQIVFICVGTPAKENGDYNLSYVFSAAKSIGENLKKYTVIVIKSTVPPCTSEAVEKIIKKQTKTPFDLASCPEFLREGSAVKDSLSPSRIVIGVESKKAKALLLKLHRPIKGPRLVCDIKSAQMIKYAANAFLASKISFINSIARLCDAIGANVEQVAKGLGLDPRIGHQFLQAGLGYGGSCFPKDTWALIAYAQRLGYDFKFLKEVDNINQGQIDYFVDKIIKACQGSIKGKTLTILGLAFKPKTDDMRKSRAIPLIKKLQQKGAKINAYDPVAMNNAQKILKKVNFYDTPYKALEKSSALVLVTEWPEFKKLDFRKIRGIMKEKLVIDGRNIYDSRKLKNLGFKYEGMGRK